jgi:hypothetical protein
MSSGVVIRDFGDKIDSGIGDNCSAKFGRAVVFGDGPENKTPENSK